MKIAIPIKIGTGCPVLSCLKKPHVEPTKNTNEQSTMQHNIMLRGRYALQQNRKKENWKQPTTTIICPLAYQYTIATNPLQNMLKP